MTVWCWYDVHLYSVEWLDDICWWFCRSGCGFLHMKIVNLDGKFILGQFSQPFDSIPQMIEFYCLSKLPIKGSENISLVHPLANGCSLWYADVSVRTDSLSAGYVYMHCFSCLLVLRHSVYVAFQFDELLSIWIGCGRCWPEPCRLAVRRVVVGAFWPFLYC